MRLLILIQIFSINSFSTVKIYKVTNKTDQVYKHNIKNGQTNNK